jgi:hypothetical protein
MSFRIFRFDGEGHITHEDSKLLGDFGFGRLVDFVDERHEVQKNFKNKAKKSFRINKSLRKWDKTKPTQAEAESPVHTKALR